MITIQFNLDKRQIFINYSSLVDFEIDSEEQQITYQTNSVRRVLPFDEIEEFVMFYDPIESSAENALAEELFALLTNAINNTESDSE
jgi:hypothetical protein